MMSGWRLTAAAGCRRPGRRKDHGVGRGFPRRPEPDRRRSAGGEPGDAGADRGRGGRAGGDPRRARPGRPGPAAMTPCPRPHRLGSARSRPGGPPVGAGSVGRAAEQRGGAAGGGAGRRSCAVFTSTWRRPRCSYRAPTRRATSPRAWCPDHVSTAGGEVDGGVSEVPVPGIQPSHAPTPATAETTVEIPMTIPRFRHPFHHESRAGSAEFGGLDVLVPLPDA
jgi:hypothetical protein